MERRVEREGYGKGGQEVERPQGQVVASPFGFLFGFLSFAPAASCPPL